jgi:hypothetical protein
MAIEVGGKAPATPYGTFLDQLEAGNVASVTFEGTEIHGRFKTPVGEATPKGAPVGEATPNGAAQRDVFRTRLPDFGDTALIAELRKQRVAIDVAQPSPWTWLLGHVPLPMLAILAVALVAGIGRMVRGGPAGTGPTGPAMGHPMVGLLSGLFARQRSEAAPPTPDREGPTSR